MIKIIICTALTFQSAISFCQLSRIDEFGLVEKKALPLKIESVKATVEFHEEQKLAIEPQKNKDIPASNIVRLFKPLKTLVPTSDFGNRIHPITGEFKYHTGIDYKAFYEPVYSIADGKVVKAGYNKISGNYLVIEHGAVSSIYCHLQEIYYSAGEFVQGGTIIAKSGNTGRSTGPHLHFGLKYLKKDINPGLLSVFHNFNN